MPNAGHRMTSAESNGATRIRTVPSRSAFRIRAVTLIEILVVIAIITALAGMLIVSTMALQSRGAEQGTRSFMERIAAAQAQYLQMHRMYVPNVPSGGSIDFTSTQQTMHSTLPLWMALEESTKILSGDEALRVPYTGPPVVSDAFVVPEVESGTSGTGSTASTLKRAASTTDWTGYNVKITSGALAGEQRRIASVDAADKTILNVDSPWSAAPASGVTYLISRWYYYVDRWNTPLRYECRADAKYKTFKLTSCGKDLTPGTGDDIVIER